MEQQPQTYYFTWQGIEIEAVYQPFVSERFSTLAIQSVRPRGAALPISKTGYRSYVYEGGWANSCEGDAIAQVTAWLDEGSTAPEWQEHIESARQGELF